MASAVAIGRFEQASVEPEAGPRMADPDVVAHDRRAEAALRRRFLRQLRQQNLLRGPTGIANADAYQVAREGDRPVALLPIRHHQGIDMIGKHQHAPVADFHAVHGGVDHGGQIAPYRFEGFANRSRGKRGIADEAGVPRLVLGAELQAELRIVQQIGADLQQLQIADQRHTSIRIGQVARFETRAAQGVAQVGPRASAYRRRGRRQGWLDLMVGAGELGDRGPFRCHWRDLARLWRTISRLPCLCPSTPSNIETVASGRDVRTQRDRIATQFTPQGASTAAVAVPL